MPSYSFLNESTGEQSELWFAMADAPSIGSTVSIDGIEYVRVVGDYQIDTGANRSQYPYVSNSLPKNLSGMKADRNGKPVIMSKRHEREVMAQHGYVKE